MKFRQRQILLSVGLFCFAVFLVLHSKTPPDNIDPVVSANRRDAQAFFRTPHAATLKKNQADKAPPPEKHDLKAHLDDGKTAVSEENPDSSLSQRKRPGLSSIVYVNQISNNSDCPELLRPDKVKEETQVFQKVDGSSSMLEFSAFLDVDQKLVRVVGLGESRAAPSVVYCFLWYRGQGAAGEESSDPDPAGMVNDEKELRVVVGKITPLPEHHGRKYGAHYIHCPLPNDSSSTHHSPYAVSLSTQDCRQPSSTNEKNQKKQQPTNILAVLRAPKELQRNFTVCVTALNYRYSRAYELVEMIELNRQLGAQMFTFYVNSVGENVRKVLRWYEERGLVQLVDWELPMVVDHWPPAKEKPEVHYFAQLASHNDCLNRHRGVSRYLVYQDLDEFIIPKRTSSWGQMLASLNTREPSGYIFRCVFFRKDWPPNSENFTGKATADKFRSIVLATDKREPNYFSYNHRAKYIVDPKAVQIVGIHNVWKFRWETRMVQVREGDALLHHYRSWENPGDVARAVRDTDIYRFKDQLVARLEQRWGELPQVPLDIPISQYGQV